MNKDQVVLLRQELGEGRQVLSQLSLEPARNEPLAPGQMAIREGVEDMDPRRPPLRLREDIEFGDETGIEPRRPTSLDVQHAPFRPLGR